MKRNTLPKVFSPKAIETFFKHLKKVRLSTPTWSIRTDILFYWIALVTGLRVSEICRIKNKNLRYRGGHPTVRVTTKWGGQRTARLPKPLWDALKRYIQTKQEGNWGFRPDDYTLSSYRSIKPVDRGTVWRRLKVHLKDAKLPTHFNVHTFRHTFASMLLAKTSAPKLVQRLLDHRSLDSTYRYMHLISVLGTKRVAKMLDVPLDDLADDAMRGEHASAGRHKH